jgi:hypothetical protein
VFRNSAYGWKLGGALALAAALAAFSAWKGESIHPPAWKCLAQPDLWHGEELRVLGKVLSVGREDFVLLWQEAPLTVRHARIPSPGADVEVVGTLDRDGPCLRARGWRALPPRARFRWIWEAVSLAVLALILANFLRHFAFRPEAARLGGR